MLVGLARHVFNPVPPPESGHGRLSPGQQRQAPVSLGAYSQTASPPVGGVMHAALPQGFCPAMQPVTVHGELEPLEPQPSGSRHTIPRSTNIERSFVILGFGYSMGEESMSRAQRNPQYGSMLLAGAETRLPERSSSYVL